MEKLLVVAALAGLLALVWSMVSYFSWWVLVLLAALFASELFAE